MIDPYKVLGVSRNATEEEIKKAYRQKAKEYHPDLHPNDPAAAQKMNEVNEAYDMLKNPEKYERKRAQEQAQNAYRRQSTYGGYGSNTGYGSGSYGNSYGGQRTTGSSSGSGSGYDSYEDSRGYGYGRGGYYSGFGGFNFEDLFGGFSGYQQRYDTTPRVQAGDSPEMVRAINAIQSGMYREAVTILSSMTSSYRNGRWYYVSAVAYYGSGDRTQALSMIQRALQQEPNNRMYQQLLNQYGQTERTGDYGYSRRGFNSMSLLRIIGIVLLILFLFNFLTRCSYFFLI